MMHEEAVNTKWYIMKLFVNVVHEAFCLFYCLNYIISYFEDIFYLSISEVSTFTKVLSPVNELFITSFKRLVFPFALELCHADKNMVRRGSPRTSACVEIHLICRRLTHTLSYCDCNLLTINISTTAKQMASLLPCDDRKRMLCQDKSLR